MGWWKTTNSTKVFNKQTKWFRPFENHQAMAKPYIKPQAMRERSIESMGDSEVKRNHVGFLGHGGSRQIFQGSFFLEGNYPPGD